MKQHKVELLCTHTLKFDSVYTSFQDYTSDECDGLPDDCNCKFRVVARLSCPNGSEELDEAFHSI